jgi:hypothetical protein
MSTLWRLFRWYVLGVHSRWGVRYTFAHGWIATPDYLTRKEAAEEYHRVVVHPPEDLLMIELIDSGKTVAMIHFHPET